MTRSSKVFQLRAVTDLQPSYTAGAKPSLDLSSLQQVVPCQFCFSPDFQPLTEDQCFSSVELNTAATSAFAAQENVLLFPGPQVLHIWCDGSYTSATEATTKHPSTEAIAGWAFVIVYTSPDGRCSIKGTAADSIQPHKLS